MVFLFSVYTAVEVNAFHQGKPKIHGTKANSTLRLFLNAKTAAKQVANYTHQKTKTDKNYIKLVKA